MSATERWRWLCQIERDSLRNHQQTVVLCPASKAIGAAIEDVAMKTIIQKAFRLDDVDVIERIDYTEATWRVIPPLDVYWSMVDLNSRRGIRTQHLYLIADASMTLFDQYHYVFNSLYQKCIRWKPGLHGSHITDIRPRE